MERFLIWWARGTGLTVILAAIFMFGLAAPYGRPAGSTVFCAFIGAFGILFIVGSFVLPSMARQTQKGPPPK